MFTAKGMRSTSTQVPNRGACCFLISDPISVSTAHCEALHLPTDFIMTVEQNRE